MNWTSVTQPPLNLISFFESVDCYPVALASVAICKAVCAPKIKSMKRDVKSVQVVVGRAKAQPIGRWSKLSSHLIPHKKVNMHTGNLGQLAYVGFSFLEFSLRLTMLLFCDLSVGTAGDSLTYHRGYPFSTKDQDNDNWNKHCAEQYKGAWWYGSCLHSNLNGPYRHGKFSSKTSYDGVVWHHWKGNTYSLKRAEMKLRPEKF